MSCQLCSNSQQLLQLLQAGAKQGKVPAELFMPPAAAELSSEAAMELMQSGVKYIELPAAFYELPAVQQLNSEQVLQLLQAGASKRQVPYWLCKLPAMAGISSAALLQVVHTALVKQDTMYVQSLIAGFPGEWIESLTADTKFALLKPAVKRWHTKGHIIGFKDLAGAMSSGEQLSSEQVLSLLSAALVTCASCRPGKRSAVRWWSRCCGLLFGTKVLGVFKPSASCQVRSGSAGRLLRACCS
jgi:hypothetical protein